MKLSLQNHYKLITEGKGHKDIFLKDAKTQFPNYIINSNNYNQAVELLKDKGIINENIVSIMPINSNTSPKEDFEDSFASFLLEEKKAELENSEKVKAEEKTEVEQYNIHDNADNKNIDNVIFDQLMAGYYIEMKKPKNADKTIEDIKNIVLKNLQKDPIFYVTKGQFGLEDVGYEVEVPGLGTPKEPKGPYKASGYGNLSEHQLSTSINTSGVKGGGGRRFVPDKFPLPKKVRQQFKEHMVYNNGTLYVSSILYNNLIKGYTNQPAIKKLIMDLPPMVKQVLNKTESYNGMTQLPKEYKTYFPLKYPVEISKEDKFNKDRTKQYWGEGDLLIPNPKKLKEEEMIIKENKLRGIISKIIREELSKSPLNESNIIKRLKEIEIESTDEVKQSKISKLQDEIRKRQDQLDMIEKNEDLKMLIDKKKVKELEREIKELERACSKLDKSKKKDIIDEDGDDSLDENEKDDYSRAEEMYDAEFEETGTADIESIADNFPGMEEEIINHLEGYTIDTDSEY